MDLRVRVMADVDAGVGTLAVAKKYSVSDRFVRELKQLRRETGSLEPRHGKTGPPPILDESDYEAIGQFYAANPEASTQQLIEFLAAQRGKNVKLSLAKEARLAAGLTRKKKRPTPPSNNAPTLPPPVRRTRKPNR